MRFENWDVLLFPDGSKVPIQEFKTQCFVTRDSESPYMHIESLVTASSHPLQPSYAQGIIGYTPILTTFVPSMSRNSPFRISIHSWKKPAPTRMMESLMQPDDSVMFEMRVFIDGIFIAGSLTNQRTGWPQVIDSNSHVDKNGDQDCLHFPAFHEEMLQQSHWEAGEEFGRIKIVVAEGFSRPNRNPPFERVRNLVFFSFQHAPLNILEGSNLAWPNPGMWHQASRPSFKYHLGVDYGGIRENEDAHSHSPTRPEPRGIGISDASRSSQYTTWPQRLYPTPQTSWARPALPARDSRWPLQPVVQDPFIDSFREPGLSRRSRSTLDDVSMPDYAASSSNSSRAISNMTGISFGQHSKEPSAIAPIDDEQYNQLIEALSPGKLTSGTHAPTNTPSSAHPMASKQCAAKESRARRSHSKHPSRPGALKELSQPGVRAVSGSSPRSDSDEGLGSENAPLPSNLLSPNPKVKGKKEGTGSEVDTPLYGSNRVLTNSAKTVRRSQSSITASAESKRKRLGTSEQVEIAEDTESGSPSPTKKISRLEAKDLSPRSTLEEALEARTRVTATRRETEASG
ncbi:hypothetical protein BDBG_04018 [Blastomyces gilchristii SLH14081]|uniref:Uncharacterized protein n=1 Tax=Blastomyces gilchristii (strain SLH14081) TaxID=559298 RepID=A0A179ULY4_BLAGS|nr:uncharacterized protein BDBG_04018 [Blastomyces gilchristii SLH14081]OAT08021.1 hypothetical protein BDBG_04018 [Blastomyces gilchristii SLH14081]